MLAWVLLTAIPPLIPVAIYLAVRWSLAAPVVQVEPLRGAPSLERSAQLVRGRWFRTDSLVGLSAAVALVAGPLLGALLIFVAEIPLAWINIVAGIVYAITLAWINIVAGIVYAITLPYVGLVTAYAYFDARARNELEPLDRPAALPAEISLEPSSAAG